MKIYYITRARIPTEKAHGLQIAKMCESYAENGNEVTLVVPYRKNKITDPIWEYYGLKKNFSCTWVKVPDLIVFAGRFDKVLFWLHALFFMFGLLRLKIPKEAVIKTRSPELAWWYHKRGYKTIFELCDWPHSGVPVFAHFLRSADVVVAQSQGVADECIKCGARNVIVGSNGVDIELFDQKRAIKLLKAEVLLPTDKQRIFYIGALEKWKGIEILLEASTQFPSDTVTVIVGGNESQTKLYKKKYHNAIFLGQTPYKELPQYQELADILVVPNDPCDVQSKIYTSPIKLFAHMASGKPIIVTDLPSMRTIVSEKEVFFFNGTASDLAQKVKYVLLHPEEAKARAAAARVKVHEYSWTARAKNIITALTKNTKLSSL